MPRFFIDSAPENGVVRITGEDAHHIARVLRMKPGEELTACDGAGTDYLCAFERLEDGAAVCRVGGAEPSRGEPTVRATLFMALPKSDKMDLIVQKATELGVHAIVPFVGARCVSKPDEKSMGKKLVRWQKIVREAAMQCGRGAIPTVQPCVSFKQAVQMANALDLALFFYESERQNGARAVLSAERYTTVGLMVGPEGGFDPAEAEAAVQAGMESVSLGPRILRCETAPMAALTALMYESGNL